MNEPNEILRPYRKRMARQIPILSEQGQKKVAATRVEIVGSGGTGESVALLTGLGGFVYLTLIDGDRIESSNLNRLPLAGIGDVGEFKVLIAKRELEKRFREMRIRAIAKDVRSPGVWEQAKDCNWVVDCTDEDQVKKFLNQKCIQDRLPLVSTGSGFITRNGRLVGAGCRVNRVRHGDACLQCQVLDDQSMQQARGSLGVLNMMNAVLGTELLIREVSGYMDVAMGDREVNFECESESCESSGNDVNFIFFDMVSRTLITQKVIPTPGCAFCERLNSAEE